jgi:hypothetical protein
MVNSIFSLFLFSLLFYIYEVFIYVSISMKFTKLVEATPFSRCYSSDGEDCIVSDCPADSACAIVSVH